MARLTINRIVMALIRLTDIEKSFRDGRDSWRRVLCGVNLTLAAGEMVSVRGVSGSGKTTLLSILGTTLKADKGYYLFDGHDITHKERLLTARYPTRLVMLISSP